MTPQEPAQDRHLWQHALSGVPPSGRSLGSAQGRLEQAIERTAQWLLGQQQATGYWCGELQGDTILESEYILLQAWLEQESSDLCRRAAQYLLDQQLPAGGWSLYPGGPADISVSVKAYFALKLTGHSPGIEPMTRARNAILQLGGADRVNSFTRYYLALLGQIEYRHCPAVPPEMVLLPRWFPINIYRMSAWSRTILVPLSMVWAQQPVRTLAEDQGIRELFMRPADEWLPPRAPGREAAQHWFSWDRFFLGVDRIVKIYEHMYSMRFLRRWAMRSAERWVLERSIGSDGLGAIFPPIVWSLIGLRSIGRTADDPHVRECEEQLQALVLQDDRSARLQPCKSPVWDTALTVRTLASIDHPRIKLSVRRAVDWLLDKEVRQPGDWSRTVRCEPSGWYFEHRNPYYPDIDDTAMVLLGLREMLHRGMQYSGVRPQAASASWTFQTRADSLGGAHQELVQLDRIDGAARRAQAWMLAMQNRDGGWGAFDKNNDCQFLCAVPFADHNAMIDPSTPDITGRVLEALGMWGYRREQPGIRQGIDFLRRTQELDGAWYGRWGVNYIYGTWQALAGLQAVGVPARDRVVQLGAQWLCAHQQPDGGWGESPHSYADPATRGEGPATPSQTAWAILGLLAAGLGQHPSVTRAVRWLLDRQATDGTWPEPEFTGTGFPQVFYLRYHYYPVYFPLLALRRWQELTLG